MNIFRLAGDVSHLLAIIILLVKIWRSKSCAGKQHTQLFLYLFIYLNFLELVFRLCFYFSHALRRGLQLCTTVAATWQCQQSNLLRAPRCNANTSRRLPFILFAKGKMCVFHIQCVVIRFKSPFLPSLQASLGNLRCCLPSYLPPGTLTCSPTTSRRITPS